MVGHGDQPSLRSQASLGAGPWAHLAMLGAAASRGRWPPGLQPSGPSLGSQAEVREESPLTKQDVRGGWPEREGLGLRVPRAVHGRAVHGRAEDAAGLLCTSLWAGDDQGSTCTQG